MIIRVATRGSALSIRQAEIVMRRILEFNPDVEFKLVIVRTTGDVVLDKPCLLYTSPSPRDRQKSRMPSSA